MDYKFNYDTLINSRKLLVRNKKSKKENIIFKIFN